MLPHVPCAGDSPGCPQPWVRSRAASLSATTCPQSLLKFTSNAPLLLPGGQCWGWKAQVRAQPFPRHHKVLTNRGSCFRPPGKSAWFDTDTSCPCPPQLLAAPKHGWASLHPHPAALQGPEQPGRAALVGVSAPGSPGRGRRGLQKGRDGGAGLVTPLAVAAGSATGDSGWPRNQRPVCQLAPCP